MTTTSPSTGDRPGFEPRHPNAVPARCDGCPAPARWTRGGSRYCDEHAVLTTPMFRTSPASMGGPLSEAERIAEIRAKHMRAIDHDGDENGFDSSIEYCAYCENDEWPCEPALLADAIDQLQGQLDAVLAVRPLPTRPNATRITLAGAKGHALALADIRRALGRTPEQIRADLGLTPAPEMPRPPTEEGPTEEQRAELIVGLLFGEPGTANESAQEPVSGPETAGTGSGRGTGVAEALGTAQAVDGDSDA